MQLVNLGEFSQDKMKIALSKKGWRILVDSEFSHKKFAYYVHKNSAIQAKWSNQICSLDFW